MKYFLNKQDYDITFYVLDNFQQWDVVEYRSGVFHPEYVLESLVNRWLITDAIEYLKFILAHKSLVECPAEKLQREYITIQFHFLYRILEYLKQKDSSNILSYNILIRYLENLLFALSKTKLKLAKIPIDWLEIYEENQRASRTSGKKILRKINYCLISPKGNLEALRCSLLFQKYSLIGFLFGHGFTIKEGIGRFREKLLEKSERRDYTITSTQDYIKKEFNPKKEHKSEIQVFLDVFLRNLPDRDTMKVDESFRPQNKISRKLYDVVKAILVSFPKSDEKLVDNVLEYAFEVQEDDIERYSKELFFIKARVEEFVSQ